MLRGIWNYLRGYVIIVIKGTSLERFVNLAVHGGIHIWNVRRTGPMSVRACMDVGSFYALHRLGAKLGCSVRIEEKRGLIMTLSRLRERRVLLYGWILIVALMLSASRCIWFVDVEGCDRISEGEILSLLEGMGVAAGAKRNGITTYELGKAIMASDGRIAWAGANLNGVILNVTIKEAEPIEMAKDASHPASIYAARDGVIVGMTVLEGRALVGVGDAVRKGDELISGVLRNDETGTILVHATGKVVARTLYRFSAEAGPLLRREARTGNRSDYLSLSLLGYELFDAGEDGKSEREMRARYVLSNCFLPLIAEWGMEYELGMGLAEADEAELKAAAYERAESLMAASIPSAARLVSKQSETQIEENGTATAVIAITAEENIGETRDIR